MERLGLSCRERGENEKKKDLDGFGAEGRYYRKEQGIEAEQDVLSQGRNNAIGATRGGGKPLICLDLVIEPSTTPYACIMPMTPDEISFQQINRSFSRTFYCCSLAAQSSPKSQSNYRARSVPLFFPVAIFDQMSKRQRLCKILLCIARSNIQSYALGLILRICSETNTMQPRIASIP